jgi:hypothetical protein
LDGGAGQLGQLPIPEERLDAGAAVVERRRADPLAGPVNGFGKRGLTQQSIGLGGNASGGVVGGLGKGDDGLIGADALGHQGVAGGVELVERDDAMAEGAVGPPRPRPADIESPRRPDR